MMCPISWLRLEQHHLGEIAGDERSEIEAHLRTCEACREAAGAIAADARPLRLLRRKASKRPIVLSALALAAAILIFVVKREPPEGRMKGSDVVLTLVGEREGRVEGVYREGEPLKALVTCPPGLSATFELVVHSGSDATSPLEPQTIACGNSVPLRGAFRLTGEAQVCLRWARSSERCVTLTPERQ
jgi:hypothetical protein